jgi:UTP--glucose-1-phosphate uridylyltransferase
MRITKAVVPAAGRGTRLLPATRVLPKEMLPLGRKPAIQYVMEEVAGAGLEEVVLISGPGKRAIADYFDGGGGPEPWQQLRYTHVLQEEPRGLADAVARAEEFVAGAPFVVALGDSFIVSDEPESVLSRMIAAHLARRPAATIAVQAIPQEHVGRYGVVAPKEPVEGPFAIREIVEKPKPEEAPSNLVVAGRYLLDPVIFDAIRRIEPGKGGELWLTDALKLLLREGREIVCVPLTGSEHRLDVGNFESYFQAFLEVAFNDPEHGESVRAWAEARWRDSGRESP